MAKKTMSPIERAQAELDALQGAAAVSPTGDATPAGEPPAAGDAPAPAAAAQPAQDHGQPPASATPPQDDPNSETYKSRWLSLQGMHKRFEEQIASLADQNRQLLGQVNDLLARQAQTPPADAGNPLPTDASVAQIAEHMATLEREYGEKFTVAMRGFVRGEIATEVDRILKERLQPMEQRVGNVEQSNTKTQQQLFEEKLESAAPGWQETVNLAEFGAWLKKTVNPASGQTFEELFIAANKAWDMDRLAWFINTFTKATGRAPQQLPDAQSQAAQHVTPDDPREALVTPGRSHATDGAGRQSQQPRVWTGPEITAFYRDLRTGKYKGREAEAAAIEADIVRANAEGRTR